MFSTFDKLFITSPMKPITNV